MCMSLKLLNDITTDDFESDTIKNDNESEARQDIAEQILDTYERRRLHRRGATRQSFRDVRERGPLRQRRHRLAIQSAESSLLAQEDDTPDQSNQFRHVATSHEDTSAGAVHCFKDEFGLLSARKLFYDLILGFLLWFATELLKIYNFIS